MFVVCAGLSHAFAVLARAPRCFAVDAARRHAPWGAPRERLERGQAPGHSEFAWRNAAGHLACNKPYHCFSKICCATILQYQNTTFISWQQMFLNAETLSMIPGFVLEINHAFLWEGIRNGKHAVPAPCSQRPPIRFLIAADCKRGSL